MTKQKSLIGTELDCITKHIEFTHLKNLEASKSVGHDLIKNLPSFVYGNLVNSEKIYKILHLNSKHVLLSRESIFTHRNLKIGESVNIRTFLREAYEQQASSNPIGFIILESIGSVDEDIAFYCERVLAVRGGFSRGRS